MRLGLAGRLILFGLLTASLLALMGGWLLHQGLHESMRRSFEQRLDERADLVAARFSVRPGASPIYAEPRSGDDFERIFSGWYWQLSGAGVQLHSRSLWDGELGHIRALSSQRLDAVGPQQEPLFGVARQLALAGHGELRLEVFGPAAPVLDELRAFDRSLWFLLLGLLFALGALTLVQVRLGLRPLARLRSALDEVEDGTRERLGAGYGPDLDPFAAQLDALLARNARIVTRARGHAADLAHALKKPLALLRSEAELKSAVPAALIDDASQAMTRLIERHLARAGSGAGDQRKVALRPRVEALVQLMRQLHGTRALIWQVDVPAALNWRGEPTDLEEMLGNLLDNAGKWARSQVRIEARAADGYLILVIDDDGPGLSPEQLAQAAQRGRRFDEQVEGSGLGLAISADIALTYEGRLVLSAGPLGGLRAELRLPL